MRAPLLVCFLYWLVCRWLRVRGICVVVRDWCPRTVRIEPLGLCKFIQSAWSKVLLVDNAVLADHETFDPRFAVLSRCSYEGETADHRTFYYVIHFPERCCGTLTFQNLEKISVIGFRIRRVASFNYPSNLLTDRTSPTSIGVLPS